MKNFFTCFALVLLLPLGQPQAWAQLAEQDDALNTPDLQSVLPATIDSKPQEIEIKRMPRLSVRVEGLAPSVGSVEISLFNSAETFMVEPFMQDSGVPDEEGVVEVRFLNVFEGEYGLVVVHDENDNGLYDSGFLGFGAEPVAYSNDASPWLGRPSFDAVRFEVQEDLQVTIQAN
jgi:uncharacterized protein (DUF2141 family)